MTNSINNTVVGKPLVTGGVLVGPVGAPLPTDALTAPVMATAGNSNGFTATGYVTDNGVTKSEKRNTAVLYAWGGDTIAVTQKGYDVTIKVDLAEFLNQLVQGLIYGPANVTFTAATPAPPVLTLGTTAGTGGTFTAGSVSWQVTATTAAGETAASNSVSATLTATSTQALSWTAPSGATIAGYKVYRTQGGNTVLVATVAAGTTTYTDTGTAGTAGAPPATGTAGTAGNKLAVKATSAPTPRNSWIFEIFSNTAHIRIVVPVGKVMDIGDTVFSDAALAAYPVTLQAFPDASGGYFYVYTDDGQHD